MTARRRPSEGRSATAARVLIAGGGTGGHLMPALAIAGRLRERRPDLEPVLVGARRGIEAMILPNREFRYHLLPTEPLYRRQWWRNIRWPVVAIQIADALTRLFEYERPVAVVGTGGYASAPAVWLATRYGLPTAIQEQNAYPGIATRLLARRVRHVYLGMPEAGRRLRLGRQTEVFDTGNPIPPPELDRRASARTRFGLEPGKPVLLVTGGSQGALAINETVAQWIERGGAEGLSVIWATGWGTYQRFARYDDPPQIQVFGFIDPVADAYAAADLVVGRAGMMTGAELCAWGLPSILVPLPSAAGDHQRHNAEALVAAGACRMILQRELTVERFGTEVRSLLDDPERLATMAAAARTRGRPDAADQIVSHLLTFF
jgi:UDP-N-acetylglucosamine--N-acetylmuramyl-(pentapeptide) pyrophosphoryl-undecaprenol N-acetylglucosamine transferase